MLNLAEPLRRGRTDISDVGESTLDVGEQTVGETIRRRNDCNSEVCTYLSQLLSQQINPLTSCNAVSENGRRTGGEERKTKKLEWMSKKDN